MLQVPDYDKISEIESKLCSDELNLSDDVLKLIFDLEKLKEVEGRYYGNMFPEERKPVDANYVIDRLECIIGIAECMTTGNIAHQRPNIICQAQNLINKIKQDIKDGKVENH